MTGHYGSFDSTEVLT